MNLFNLDERLEQDCHVLGLLGDSTLLLSDNSLVPWFIIVPHVSETEFTELDETIQIRILKSINLVARFMKNHFELDKLNIATIGNIVRQMHIHIIARSEQDYAWPGVVWGNPEKEPYNMDQVDTIKHTLRERLGESFEPLL